MKHNENCREGSEWTAMLWRGVSAKIQSTSSGVTCVSAVSEQVSPVGCLLLFIVLLAAGYPLNRVFAVCVLLLTHLT